MERRERKNAVTVLAPAKLNLALDVVGLLPNGYHALDMTMQTITLYERVMLRRSAGLSLRLPGSLVQPNDKNTAIKAALAFFHYTGLLAGVDITIYKNTPVRAGMAGGSAAGSGGRGTSGTDIMVLSDEIYAEPNYGSAAARFHCHPARYGRAHHCGERLFQELRHDRLAAGLCLRPGGCH